MKNWRVMIVGLLALVAAVLVGLNWTSVSGTANRESEQEKVAVKAEKPKKKDSAMRNLIEKNCKKFIAERVADADEGDVEDACACAADDIHNEFGDDLLDMMKANKIDPETAARADALMQECAEQAGLEP